jgi:hypothetical protein
MGHEIDVTITVTLTKFWISIDRGGRLWSEVCPSGRKAGRFAGPGRWRMRPIETQKLFSAFANHKTLQDRFGARPVGRATLTQCRRPPASVASLGSSIGIGPKSALGASFPLTDVTAKASSPNAERPLSLSDGNWSPCPIARRDSSRISGR